MMKFILIVISILYQAHSLSVSPKKPHVVVVGAGWGGWGAAKALCENGCKVTLLDGMPDPTGSKPLKTASGKPFEAGTRGFWKDYPNIIKLVNDLGFSEDEIFTPFTNSSFYSPFGLEATAPVFSNSNFLQLPSPIGQVLASAKLFERIPISDRASMIGLLYAIIDFTRNNDTFEAYDRMSAHELFIRMKVSKRLVDDFIRPTLLVGLFKPPEELSAAIVMELLYYYALAHQTSFDVRWIKQKTISESIISPLASYLSSTYDITVLGNSRVETVGLDATNTAVKSITYSNHGNSVTIEDVSGCVLAVGATGLRGILTNSQTLAKQSPELTNAASLGAIDVIACRLWLNKVVPTRSPVNVFSKFESLRGAGGTFFLLDQLQGNSEELWGGDSPQGSVVACDFYNAGALLPLSDEDIKSLLIKELLPSAVPAFSGVEVVDFCIGRYPRAVSWFSPGSFKKRPPTVLPTISNLVCAGDWVRMGEREHGAKGLCQERALVSGFEAANALARSGVLDHTSSSSSSSSTSSHRKEFPVIPIRDDEPQVIIGKLLNSRLKSMLERFGVSASPWVR